MLSIISTTTSPTSKIPMSEGDLLLLRLIRLLSAGTMYELA